MRCRCRGRRRSGCRRAPCRCGRGSGPAGPARGSSAGARPRLAPGTLLGRSPGGSRAATNSDANRATQTTPMTARRISGVVARSHGARHRMLTPRQLRVSGPSAQPATRSPIARSAAPTMRRRRPRSSTDWGSSSVCSPKNSPSTANSSTPERRRRRHDHHRHQPARLQHRRPAAVPAANATRQYASADRPSGAGAVGDRTADPAQNPTTAPRWAPPLSPAQMASTTIMSGTTPRIRIWVTSPICRTSVVDDDQRPPGRPPCDRRSSGGSHSSTCTTLSRDRSAARSTSSTWDLVGLAARHLVDGADRDVLGERRPLQPAGDDRIALGSTGWSARPRGRR